MMRVSVREVFDLSKRCFMAADFAEGPAKANAQAIWWTEAYRRSGLTTLHSLLDSLSELQRSALTLDHRGDGISVVEGGDQPSLVSSTPALDLSCSQASQHGIGVTYATTSQEDETAHTLGHVARRAVERGYLPIVLFTDNERGPGTIVASAGDSQPVVAELELPASSASFVDLLQIVRTGIHEGRHSPLTQAVFKHAADARRSSADGRLLDRLLSRATEPVEAGRAETETGFFTICVDPDHPAQSDGVRRTFDQFLDDRETTYDPRRMQERTERLLYEGVEIDRSVWRDIFEFGSGILAPEFEGSYRGAGFELDE